MPPTITSTVLRYIVWTRGKRLLGHQFPLGIDTLHRPLNFQFPKDTRKHQLQMSRRMYKLQGRGRGVRFTDYGRPSFIQHQNVNHVVIMLGSTGLKWGPWKFMYWLMRIAICGGRNLTVLKTRGFIFFKFRSWGQRDKHKRHRRHRTAKRNCILTTRRRTFQVRTKLQQAVWPTKCKIPCPLPNMYESVPHVPPT